ncbi:hypothetical protein RUM43_009059 [Polyplax serrata]|uniref:Uncharacterized protein n=1 Tax=Polyplax serrata TaxID=468196 RepID=A0AAN8S8C6_POLSC
MARRGHEKEREKHERRLTRRRASADSLLPLDKFATDTTSSVASSSPEPTTPIPTPRPIKTCPDDDSEDINCESPPQITSTVDSAASSGRSRSPPSSPPPPRNPLLQERFNCEELRNVVREIHISFGCGMARTGPTGSRQEREREREKREREREREAVGKEGRKEGRKGKVSQKEQDEVEIICMRNAYSIPSGVAVVT